MNDVFFSLGSNIKPEFYIPQAVYMLSQNVEIKSTSTFYLTEPVGFTNQPAFSNGVLKACSNLSPGDLLNFITLVEASLGRTRGENKYGPRTVDIDLILYGKVVDEKLKIPHPDIFTRDYLVVCIYEIEPQLILPGKNISIAELRKKVSGSFKPLPELTLKVREVAGLKASSES